MTEQEIKELWEWCGFRFVDGKTCPECGHTTRSYWLHERLARRLYFEDSEIKFVAGEDNYYPELTLDNLFKYAIPEIKRRGLWLECQDTGIIDSIWFDKDPAEALAKAILEVIKDERD
jgi:hypothetical protein